MIGRIPEWIEKEANQSDKNTQDNQGMQPDQPDGKKLFYVHLPPPVIIGISDNEARQEVEEIHRKVAMGDRVCSHHRVIGFKKMIDNDQERSRSAESVKDGIMGFTQFVQC
jgi:hypothetical protein